MSYAVYQKYLARLSKTIVDPSFLAVSFHAKGIIGMHELQAITSKADTLSPLDRTIFLLTAVGKHLSEHPNSMNAVIRVFSDHHSTKDIALEMAQTKGGESGIR